MTTVVLVAHPTAMLRALRESLSHQPGVHIVGGAVDLERGITLAVRLTPDVVVLDAESAGLDASLAVSMLRRGATASAVIVVTMEPDRLASMVAADSRLIAVGKVEGAEALDAAIRRAAGSSSS